MPHNDLNITVISAGAGSGKTYNLTERMVEMLGKGVRPSAIIATTFTKKAAAELQERVRARLIEAGQSEAANELAMPSLAPCTASESNCSSGLLSMPVCLRWWKPLLMATSSASSMSRCLKFLPMSAPVK